MNNCNKPFDVLSIADVDIDTLETPPDYFNAVRAIKNPETGNIELSPVRVPGERVMPTGNLANVIALATNNTALDVPEKQVLAGYIEPQPGNNIMQLAGPSKKAQFLMYKKYTNETMLIQSTGFLRIPEGHRYIVSSQYYLGEDGEPVTDETITGQKLFIPLDDYTLMINMD